jgi:CTP synthase
LQCAVIEYARDELSLRDAHSSEFDPTSAHPVIDLMADQHDVEDKGGTMRLGVYPAKLAEGSLARRLYGEPIIYERHRHRWEVNNKYRRALEAAGMRLSGVSPDDRLVEIVELPDHPFFIASQFHPEFKSRPNHPHPLFEGFMRAALEHKRGSTNPTVVLTDSTVDVVAERPA